MHTEFDPLLSWSDLLTGDYLQEAKEDHTISEVLVDLLDLNANLPQMRVAPGSESLHK